MSEKNSPETATETAVATVPNFPRIGDAIDAVSGNLVPTSVGTDSIVFYRAALEAAGKNPDELSFDEIVRVTNVLYPISDEFRRGAKDVRKVEKDRAAAKAKADREAKAAAKDLAEIELLKAKLAAKGIAVS